MQYFFALGSHPELSQAEITSVLKRQSMPFEHVLRTPDILILDIEDELTNDFIKLLGGTIKMGTVAKTVKQVSPESLHELLQPTTDSKFHFGISGYNGFRPSHKLGLSIKKLLKTDGLSVRYVTGKENPLSSVIVEKNKLVSEAGQEIVVIKNKSAFIVGTTLAVQDFAFYSKIDYGRPASDSRSGMLPPKLAQIMINLAEAPLGGNLMDPFCGSGTVLQMAALLDYTHLLGSDRSEKAVHKTRENLQWLQHNFDIEGVSLMVEKVDARDLADELDSGSIDAIVTEPYMGPPLRGGESESQARETIKDLTRMYRKVFDQYNQILKSGGTVVMVIPSFQLQKQTFDIDLSKILPSSIHIEDHWTYSRPKAKVVRHIYKCKKA